MHFMDIMTWDPKDHEEIEKRYESWEYPKGYNVISEWIDVSSCRIFIIYELDDEEAYARATFPWKDISKLETIPIMEIEKAIEIGEKMETEMALA